MSDRSPFYDLAFPPPSKAAGREDVFGSNPPPEPEPSRRRWHVNALLFLATVVSVFAAGATHAPEDGALSTFGDFVRALLTGWTFAVPLLLILLFHEFGHYIAARIHRVDASLPYFLPLPILSPFGTMGAVIAMRGRIRSRNALLDIGASGPLAGLVVAIPVLVVGLSLSTVGPPGDHYVQEGQSLLYLLLKRVVLGPIPEGQDVQLHPTALAGWAGLLVTMLNLLPWGQLDGGHVAYALFGPRQHGFARLFRASLVPMFLYNAARFLLPAFERHAHGTELAIAVSNSMFWLMWFIALGVISRISGGARHPPTEPGELSPARRIVAAVTLAFFVLLFMPTPWATY
jgi:membrane-associated protease RseP (regulator of RpoE activity)